MARWKNKKSRAVAESTFFTLREDEVVLPDGSEKIYTLLDIPDFAGVLPILDNKFVLIRNYRYPIDEKVLEIPAGLIDEGEVPKNTAARELEEETGYKLKKSEKLVEYHPIASLNDQTAHLFLGEAEEGGKIDRDEGEDMSVELIPISETYEMLKNKEISHPHTMIALFYSKNKLLERGLIQ
ncbi:MAG: NUDIX hydrolase [Candidatus Saliniplasma sp.]